MNYLVLKRYYNNAVDIIYRFLWIITYLFRVFITTLRAMYNLSKFTVFILFSLLKYVYNLSIYIVNKMIYLFASLYVWIIGRNRRSCILSSVLFRRSDNTVPSISKRYITYKVPKAISSTSAKPAPSELFPIIKLERVFYSNKLSFTKKINELFNIFFKSIKNFFKVNYMRYKVVLPSLIKFRRMKRFTEKDFQKENSLIDEYLKEYKQRMA